MEKDSEMFKALQAELDRKMEELNYRSIEAMDNLSPMDMHQLLYNTFGEESSVGFKKSIPKSALEEVPFLKIFVEYLKVIQKKELKLTTRGNLPTKVCFDLYDRGIIKETPIESGVTKLSKEGDSIILQNLKLIAGLVGVTKKRNNKISLTQKGEKLLNPDKKEELFKELFVTNCQRFNLGYHDGYPQEVSVQGTFGYTLYLLLQYGSKRRKLDFYIEKSLLAFPYELEHFEERWTSREKQYGYCYSVRVFERFLAYYGLIDYDKPKSYLRDKEIEVQVTSLFEEIFELRPDKFKFKKSEHFA